MSAQDILECFEIPDVFCDDLPRVEVLGPNRRLYFTVRQSDLSEGNVFRVVVARLILPAESLAEIAQMLLQAEPVKMKAAAHTGVKH